jgi:hypothetical protein
MAGVFVCAALMGCATPQIAQLQTQAIQTFPRQAAPLPVPFIAQEDYECGPASLAMAMQFAGLTVTAADLVPQVYLPGRKGSLQTDMLSATRRQGLVPYLLQPQVGSILQEVAAGNPVLVFQNLSLPVYPVWHYAVVVGYDLNRNVLVLHSGTTARAEMSLYTFERTWARGNYWAMVPMQPSALPATAEPDRLAQTLAALEPVDPGAARTGYATALARWPAHPPLLLGLGNSAYALRDLAGARDAYRQTVSVKPDFADGWNNLAQVLLEQGQRDAALAAIDRAIALGGPRLARYQQLREDISAPK